MKLSIPMMVKNESKYLEKVLQSLQKIRYAIDTELIIVDTGSEDNTVEIAKKFTEKVYSHKWNNDFSEMRNITLSYATGDWLLMIDGDEILEDYQPIIDFLTSEESKKCNTASIYIKNILDESNIADTSVFLAPRLFKNRPDFRFSGAIHNQPSHKPPYHEINSTIVHYGYVATDKELMEKKFNRTGEILKRELEKDPENIYYWHQLSVTYGMHRDYNLSVEPAEKAYFLIKGKNMDLKPYIYVYHQLIIAYINNGDYDKAEKICDEAIAFAKGYVDIHFFTGNVKCLNGKYEEALEQYAIYLDLIDNYSDPSIIKDTSVINYTLGKYEVAYHDLVLIHEKNGEYDKAIEYAEKINTKKMKIKLMINIVNVYLRLLNFEGLRKFYEDEVLGENQKTVDLFEMHIENIKSELGSEKKEEIEGIFSSVSSSYAILNQVNIEERRQSGQINLDIIDKILSLDFSKLPVFYGDALYYLLKRKYSLSEILSKTRLTHIRGYLDCFIKAYPDYHSVALEYIKSNLTSDLQDARINREIEKYSLMLEKLEDDEFRYMLKRYIEDGTHHVTGIYHPDVIEKEMVSEIKEDDEVFLMYLYKARKIKDSDSVEYVRYLKKAIQVLPFKKAIEILKDEIEQQLNPPVNEEMESLKKQFKENIKILIEGKMLDQAEEVIKMYERIISSDEEILLYKSHIALLKRAAGSYKNK